MALSSDDASFLIANPSAGMVTVTAAGVAKAVRVSVAVVDGRLWSSGTQARVRTHRLRADPRCTLFVFDAAWSWRTLETVVTILDGPEVPALTVGMFRQMQNRPEGPLNWFGQELTEEEFLATMVAEERLIYDFEVLRSYGM
jgi:hypothetical protein